MITSIYNTINKSHVDNNSIQAIDEIIRQNITQLHLALPDKARKQMVQRFIITQSTEVSRM